LEAAPDFLALALPYFHEPRVAAVIAHITQPPSSSVAGRWRKRHLFKPEPSPATRTDALLATGLCILREEAVRAVGGFNAALRSGEDADLGRRLLAAGWQVVADPSLSALCIRPDSAGEVLARYARWNSPSGLGVRAFLRQLAYAVKVMVPADLRARDPLAALLSMASPFYQIRSR
jgi:cellulose synthase/poly-beta-1,6-N-acetylglucosamine synthase-like glycosyltransferase